MMLTVTWVDSKNAARAVVSGMLQIWSSTAHQVVMLSFFGYFLAGGLLHEWLAPRAMLPAVVHLCEWLAILNSVVFSLRAYTQYHRAKFSSASNAKDTTSSSCG